MARSPLVVALSLFLFGLFGDGCAGGSCPSSSCLPSGPIVLPPFYLKDIQDEKCGSQGFELLCDDESGKTVLNLPSSGNFSFEQIDYTDHSVFITDPAGCLSRRLIQGFSLNGSVFTSGYYWNFSFLNCLVHNLMVPLPYDREVQCLNTENHVVIAVPEDELLSQWAYLLDLGCENNWKATVPASNKFSSEVMENLLLKWEDERHKHGLRNGAKMGITLALTLPWLLFIFGAAYHLGIRIGEGRDQSNIDSVIRSSQLPPPSADHQQPRAVIVAGMDGAGIELYPKTVVEEIGQLPRPGDDMCPICLSSYQPKETLRTIPECNHFFHACCIDQWLIRNATCPVCRHRQGPPQGERDVMPS